MIWGGRSFASPASTLRHLRPPPSTEPQLRWFSLALVGGGALHVCKLSNEKRIEQVLKNVPNGKSTFGVFLTVFRFSPSELARGCFNRMANGGRFLVAQRSQNRFAIRLFFCPWACFLGGFGKALGRLWSGFGDALGCFGDALGCFGQTFGWLWEDFGMLWESGKAL